MAGLPPFPCRREQAGTLDMGRGREPGPVAFQLGDLWAGQRGVLCLRAVITAGSLLTAPTCPAKARSSFRVSSPQPHIHMEVRGATGAERDTRQPGPAHTFQARRDKQQHSRSHGSWRPQRIPGPHPSQVINCWGHPLPAPHQQGPHPAQEPCLPRALPGTQRPGTCPPRSALGEHSAQLQARASHAADARSAGQGTATAQPRCC